jgi:hypothetical protein
MNNHEYSYDRRTDTPQPPRSARRVLSHGGNQDLTQQIHMNSLIVDNALKYGGSTPRAQAFSQHFVNRDSHSLNPERDQRLLDDRPLARHESLSYRGYTDWKRWLAFTNELCQHPRLYGLLISTTDEAESLTRIPGFARLREVGIAPSLFEEGGEPKDSASFRAVIARARGELHHEEFLLLAVRENSLPV